MYHIADLKGEALRNKERDKHVTVYNDATKRVLIQVMAITDNVPAEVHKDEVQIVTAVSGEGVVRIIPSAGGFDTYLPLKENVSVVIDAGTRHEIVNTQPASLLRIISIYCKVK
jgi:mannose-6-phosphate isomerase-like protein (cupin superfamily)